VQDFANLKLCLW